MPTKTKIATLAALAALGLAASARSAPAIPSFGPEPASAKVAVADLGAGGGAAAKAVLQRIRNAARDVCADQLNRLACIGDTVDRAVASLDNPAVAALNGGRRRSVTLLAARGR